jgi:hypothetical protein
MLEFINNNNLTQHVLEPTRQNNIIDLVISTEDDIVNNITILEVLGDHNMINFDIGCFKTIQ